MPSVEKKITVCWDEYEVMEIIREEAGEVATAYQNRGSDNDRIDLIDGRIVMRSSVSVETFQRLAAELAEDGSILSWGEGEVDCSAGCVSVTFETTSGM